MKFETMYKGFKTEFDSIKGKYIAYDKDGDVIKEAKTEADVTKYLDDFLRGKKKVDIPFIRGVRFDGKDYFISSGKITSIAHNRDGIADEVWVNVKGNRSKKYVSMIYADTPENRAKMNEIIDIRRKIKDLEDEFEKINKTLTHPEIKVDKED